MRKATKSVATWFGISAGIAGLEHGYFEILQGSTRPQGLMIASIGPPCAAEEVWNACEPAMTIVPNFLVTGILAFIIGLLVMVWSAAFIGRNNGGMVMILLSVALLLFGGGLFPPLIGIIGGIAGIKINKPISGKQTGIMLRIGSWLWPWPLVIFMTWVLGQWFVGYFFNDFMQSAMVVGVFLILAMMPLSVFAAYAQDVNKALEGE